MPKAISTKYHGPTNTRGARITAFDSDDNRVSIPYPHELSGEAVHRKAAEALCAKMDWPGRLVGGGTKDGYVFVFDPVNVSVFKPRRPYDDDKPEGNLESDRDFVGNNMDLCVAFLESLEASR